MAVVAVAYQRCTGEFAHVIEDFVVRDAVFAEERDGIGALVVQQSFVADRVDGDGLAAV
ncbi:hypothetical protein MSIMFB_05457 [Mycobacterium simulans]|uniref:Uncharacterized protein n=1 Tax=Mycobacterium simulans TaxID=627089 RepID=A0A7Z7NDG5_9MYCO|nr:hypothetical protein [Mycobacterium simulans]SOJ57975.1 hypothetical protein MSIMFB_05457 [Mycobacterium simulans]